MNTVLKTIATLLTLSLALTTGGVSAAPSASATPNNGSGQTPASAAAANFSISVNGSVLSGSGFQSSGGKEPLIPLRAVADALGFKVTWNGQTKTAQLNKGSIFTAVKNGEDRYVINKLFTTLGTAPQMKQNRLYVPLSFASEVLYQSVTVKGQQIVIAPAAEHSTETGVITAITNADNYQSVRIQGTGKAGLVLNVSKDTRLLSKDGSPLAFSGLHIGMTVEAQHSLISTRSLPPQTPAYQITVLDTMAKDEVLGTAGTIRQVITGEDGTVSLRIQGSALSEKSQTEVVLRLTEDTAIINESGEATDRSGLVQGAEVIGFYGPVLTRSLPPTGTALKMVLNTKIL